MWKGRGKRGKHKLRATHLAKRRVTRNSPNAHFCENCFSVFFSYHFKISKFQGKEASSSIQTFKVSYH